MQLKKRVHQPYIRIGRKISKKEEATTFPTPLWNMERLESYSIFNQEWTDNLTDILKIRQDTQNFS
jgi:hypothetical protein